MRETFKSVVGNNFKASSTILGGHHVLLVLPLDLGCLWQDARNSSEQCIAFRSCLNGYAFLTINRLLRSKQRLSRFAIRFMMSFAESDPKFQLFMVDLPLYTASPQFSI